jgi:hypothetical protein
LSEYVGKNVILMGEVLNIMNGTAQIKSADGGDVYVTFPIGQVFETYV